jgi:DNA-binding MarR family transcriptional regulator
MARRSRLQDELQMSAFRSRAQEAAVSIVRTADQIRRLFVATVEPFGVTLQQYNILRILRGAGGPMCTLDVASRLIEQSPGITRHMDLLVEKGWIQRERSLDDRRKVLCAITPSGLALLQAMDAPVAAADQAAVAGLDEASLEELIDLLERVRGRSSSSEIG